LRPVENPYEKQACKVADTQHIELSQDGKTLTMTIQPASGGKPIVLVVTISLRGPRFCRVSENGGGLPLLAKFQSRLTTNL
jgi:hypothetical protein